MLISVLVVLTATIISLVAGLYAYGQSNLQEIKDNWVKYRCNPVYMPLAGLVGGDIATNFTNCTLQSVNTYAGFVLDPLYSNFKILTEVINTILDSMNSIRSAVVGASEGFLGIIKSTYGKIQNSMSSVVQIVGRIRTIMNRMITTFAILMNVVNTGIQTGQSVANGPIGQAADFLCFNPHTRLELQDGTVIPMYRAQPGMILRDGQLVRSVLHFIGVQTEMVYIDDVHVSGNHKVLYENSWIRAEDHPSAIKAPRCKVLYCLNTSKHTISIGNNVFKDYEETSDPEILRTFFKKVQAQYGEHETPEKIASPVEYRYTGVKPYTKVLDVNSREIRADAVKIGDVLLKGGRVIGIAQHVLPESTIYRRVCVPPGTLFLEADGVHMAKREEAIHQTGSFLFFQFLTEEGVFVVRNILGEEVTLLDDQETTSDEIHTWRDNEIQKEEVKV